MVSQRAIFQVNIIRWLGSGVKNPEDALAIAHRRVELGFTSTWESSTITTGQLEASGRTAMKLKFEEIHNWGSGRIRGSTIFSTTLLRTKEHTWRSGVSRY